MEDHHTANGGQVMADSFTRWEVMQAELVLPRLEVEHVVEVKSATGRTSFFVSKNPSFLLEPEEHILSGEVFYLGIGMSQATRREA